MNNDFILAKNLKLIRETNKLTQSQFAELIDVNRVTLAYIETNERPSNLSLEQLNIISKLFHIPIESILADSDLVCVPMYGLHQSDAKEISKFIRIINNYRRMCRLEQRNIVKLSTI